jgi:hypothetical protein
MVRTLFDLLLHWPKLPVCHASGTYHPLLHQVFCLLTVQDASFSKVCLKLCVDLLNMLHTQHP